MHALIRTARTTGLFYLGLAITGMIGFLLIRPQLFTAGDATGTHANLGTHEALARAGVAFELLIVLTQALAAVWFYRLFRRSDPVNALGVAAFGLVNAVIILASAAMLGAAMEITQDPFGDTASTVQTLYLVSDNLWAVGAIFFGLWLIPMGRCVLNSGLMPRPLGWTLVAGGVGYVAAAFVRYLAPDAGVIADLITIPATVGEFWVIGYLLIRGVRRSAAGDAAAPADTPAVARV
jgi:hypothetical protein